MNDSVVLVDAEWPLRAAVVAAAQRRRVPIELRVGDDPATTVDHRRVTPLGSTAVDDLRTSLALGAIVDGLAAVPSSITATILAPAAGVCGPSVAGPVDAIRDDGRSEGFTAGRIRVPWAAQALSVQQTRCWLISATLSGAVPPATLGDHVGLELLPAVVAGDTARITQFQMDRGLGAHWPEVLLLSAPVRIGDDTVVTAVYTDGLPADDLLRKALLAPEGLLTT